MITSRNCVTAFENENKKHIRDASQKILQKYKKRCQQLRSLQKKGVKSSTTYFPDAFSESKEPDILINKEKEKVPIVTNSSCTSAVRKTFLGLGNKLSNSKIFQLHVYNYILVLDIFCFDTQFLANCKEIV